MSIDRAGVKFQNRGYFQLAAAKADQPYDLTVSRSQVAYSVFHCLGHFCKSSYRLVASASWDSLFRLEWGGRWGYFRHRPAFSGWQKKHVSLSSFAPQSSQIGGPSLRATSPSNRPLISPARIDDNW